MEIGFIGLGKLGSPCAEVMAEKYKVVGYDLVDVKPKGVILTNDITETVIDKDFTFIAVPTPHHKQYDGRNPTSSLPPEDFDYSIVKNVLERLQKVNHNSTLVLISTVLPGTVRREFKNYINPEKFIYNPYLIAMGTVKDDMQNPEMIIIGNEKGFPTKDITSLSRFYHTICKCNRFVFGTWEEAEAVKIFYNTFISMKISLANMVMDVAEKNGNMDPDIVMKALSESNKRLISPMYMKPGMGDGGPCHPRDNIALSSLANRLNLGYDLFNYIAKSREEQAHNLAIKLIQYNNPVVILGKSYKPEVSLVDGSYSILVGGYVEAECGEVYYDEAPESDTPFTYLIGHRKCFYDYNFKKGSIIVDPWREFPPVNGCTVVLYGMP
jgi:UDPglucose 6-dehydrogenase